MGIEMRKSDEDLIRANRGAYEKALGAAALALRTDERIDRALTAMPKIRACIAELAGILALGSHVREAVPKHELGELMRDQQAWDAYITGKEIATAAACSAIASIEIVRPKKRGAA